MWDLRQDYRIVDVFAHIWNTSDLIVSMDGLSIMCPTEIREGYFVPWPHVDQGVLKRQDNVSHSNNPPIGFVSESPLATEPYTIQGQFLFEDSFDGDGGFYCIPKSHLKFIEFASQFEAIEAMEISKIEKTDARKQCIMSIFENSIEELGQHIKAPKGSLILWDSRTIHWNQHASNDRPLVDNPIVRMVGYLCYVPKARLDSRGKGR